MRTKNFLISMVALMMLAATGTAQTKFTAPEQKITGADRTIKAGKLVILEVTPVTTPPQHYVSSTYAWKVYDIVPNEKTKILEMLEIDDLYDKGDSAFFGAGVLTKNLTAQCIATHLYAVKDKEGKITEVGTRTVFHSVIVRVEGANPGPAPGPGPGPGPGPTPGPDEPTFPDGKFKLAATSYKLAMQHVPATNRARGAEAITRGLNSVAARISAGTLTDHATILKELRATNNSNLSIAGIPVTEWDVFGNQMQSVLAAFYRSNRLNLTSDYADAFREMAEGLSKVK